MTNEEWLEQVKQHKENLLDLVSNWHPTSYSKVQDHDMPITAPSAEWACNKVRAEIVAESNSDLAVQKEFLSAIESGNINTIYTILSNTWFGVPESTSCWRLTGFKEAVNLLDDPPEED